MNYDAILKTARSKDFMTPEGRKKAYDNMVEQGIDALVENSSQIIARQIQNQFLKNVWKSTEAEKATSHPTGFTLRDFDRKWHNPE